MISSDFLAEKSKSKALSLLKYGTGGEIRTPQKVEVSPVNSLIFEEEILLLCFTGYVSRV